MTDDTTYIFFDNIVEHTLLAESASKNGAKTIAFAVSCIDSENVAFKEMAKHRGYEILAMENDVYSLPEEFLRNVVLKGKIKIFFLSRNADRNVFLSFTVMKQFKELGLDSARLTMYIAPNWEDIENFLRMKQYELARHFDIKLVNLSRLAAYSLWRKYKPIDFLEFDCENGVALEDFKICVIGQNANTLEGVFKMYQSGRFVGSEFCVDVFDITAQAKCELVKRRYEGFYGDARITVNDVESFEGFAEKFGMSAGKYSLILVSLDSDAETECEAIRISEKLEASGNIRTVVAAFVSLPSAEIEKRAGETTNLIVVGSFAEMFSFDVIVNDSYMIGARFVNDYYNATKSDYVKMKSWVGMTEFDKGSNLSVADFNYTVIKMVGRSRFASFRDGAAYRDYLKSKPKLYENLARTEHLRWCAYLYSNGWNLLKFDGVIAANKDVEQKLHTCLVPFDDLDAISQAFNEDYKKYDYDNIDIAFDIHRLLM